MDKSYLEICEKIKSFKVQLASIIDRTPYQAMEDLQAYNALENLIAEFDDVEYTINHFSKNAVEGKLEVLPNGRFSFKGNELTCGNTLEVFEDGEWNTGHVEHKNGGYYFYSSDLKHPFLYEGMKVRIRV